ncbi:hypothetical protein BJF93_04195 [Xaviernesmea oryzae]|uniref:Uncharacterized protein n=1 Tax=Xaviernesmea oryzae TaxID=464029 RepID=A0A1Q9AUJ4_9HYPH|nr:hypothetical protein [Xaviernesmea oryzae]OLP59125.1 hypothetical protein BJF93_04195 [Xaviernesmea oryzae]SEK85553.1 hypothetical protein SAMN04487976_104203 [Xaviernesmea oryzae]
MSKAVLIGFPGDSKLYLADIEAGTVIPVDEANGGMSDMNEGAAGGAVVKGVNLAVAINSADAVFAGYFD